MSNQVKSEDLKKIFSLIQKVNDCNNNKNPIINLRTFRDQEPKYIKNFYYNFSQLDDLIKFIQEENTKGRGTHINFNYSDIAAKEGNNGVLNEDIKRLNFIFIDLDFKEESQEERERIIKEFEVFLLQNKIESKYKASGRGGKHYLIPINLKNTEENTEKIKQFVKDLNKKFKTKAFDEQRTTPNSLFRLGGTYNFKEEKPILNKLDSIEEIYLKDDIKQNSNFINKIKVEKKQFNLIASIPGKKANKQSMSFFISFLENKKQWEDLREDFFKAHDRNNIFIKNMAIFLKENPDYNELAEEFIIFLDDKKKNRLLQLKGYFKKDDFNQLNINEVLKWVNTYDLENFKQHIPENLNQFKYLCFNPSCELSQKAFYNTRVLKNCPKCKTKGLEIVNFNDLENDFRSNFENINLYQLSNYKNITYLVHNKTNNSNYLRNGSINLKEDLFLTFRNNNVNCEFLKAFYGNNDKLIENLLIQYIKENIEIRQIHDEGFKPIPEKLYFKEGRQYFNTYTGNKYLNFKKSEIPKNKQNINLENDCPHIALQLKTLTGFKEESLNYLLHWLAFKLQNPHKRTGKVIIIYGEEHTGKTRIFWEMLIEKLFEGYTNLILQRELEENLNFNEFMKNKLFVVIDESKHNPKIEDTLKALVTTQSIEINEKYGKKEKQNLFFELLAFSNNEEPLRVGVERGIYFKSKRLTEEGVYNKIIENIPKEIDNFFYYLLSLNPDMEFITKGIMTEEKEEVMETTKDIKDSFIDTLKSFEHLDTFINYINNRAYTSINLQNYLVSKEGINYIEMSLLFELFNGFLKINEYKKGWAYNKMGFIFEKLKINREKDTERLFNLEGQKVKYIEAKLLFRKIGFEREKPLNNFDNEIEKIDLNSQKSKNQIVQELINKINKENPEKLNYETLKENIKEFNLNEEDLLKIIEKLKQEGFIFEPRKGLIKVVEA